MKHVLLIASGLLLLLLGPATAQAGKKQWSVFEDNERLVATDPATRQATLDQLQDLGVDTLRVGLGWDGVAPEPNSKSTPNFDATDPANYPGFAPYDDLMRRANAMGFRVLVTLAPDAPRWATAGSRGSNYKVDSTKFAQFASAAGKRYSGSYAGLPAADLWSIWNEPSHRLFLGPRKSSPRIYRKMVEKSVPALRAQIPAGSKILVGELAPVGTATKVIGPLEFLRDWLCLNGRYKPLRGRAARKKGCTRFKKVVADGFAHHPYGSQAGNKKPRPGRDVVNISVIGRLAKALNKAARSRRITKRLPIYSTEFGFQSNPPDPFVGIGLATQARLINEAEATSYRNSRIKSYAQYLLRDDAPRPGSQSVKWAGFQTGLQFANGTSKPSLNAYKLPIVVRKRGSGVKIWGHVRPGTGPRVVQLMRGNAAAGGPIRTNSSGYFTVTRGRRSSYSFKGYVLENGAQKLVGTSRRAKPTK